MTSTVLLALAVFGACAVESVEALTIVLAAGVTRGWRSALEGGAAALVVLAAVVTAVGIPLVQYVPINVLRVVIGGLLLVLGLGWLRKAVLRASGHKQLHDEDAIYARTIAELRGEAGRRGRRDAVGFAVAFKGVFLEGMEVVLIVVSLGASSHHLGLACAMAGAAAVVVAGVGAVVARQLREVPENTLKFCVGIMLTSFGLFWVGEGAGLRWPGSDVAILVLVAGFLAIALAMTKLWRHASTPASATPASAVPTSAPPLLSPPPARPLLARVGHGARQGLSAFAHFWLDFLVGDTPELFAGTLVVVGVALGLRHDRPVGIVLVLAVTVALLAGSTYYGSVSATPPHT